MCRFVAYLGPPITLGSLITEPSNSLIHQSYDSHEQRRRFNGDGFGVAWYAPAISDEPALFRSVRPAWADPNLVQIARVTKSPCILAHVRAASGNMPVARSNCHPFVHHTLTFMHNGRVGGFARIRRPLLDQLSDEAFNSIGGSTDSEHAFALFVDHYRRTGRTESADALTEAMQSTINEILDMTRAGATSEPSFLNFAVTDGRRAAITRFTTDSDGASETLYLHYGKRYTCSGGTCRMIDMDQPGGAVLISSEPLSTDPGWHEVPKQHIVTVETDRTVTVTPIE